MVKQMLTEVVDRGRKLNSEDGSCSVDCERKYSRMLVKINFDEVQKLTWEEITFLYSLIKIITSNHISELLNREAETFTPRGPVAG